MSSDRQPTSPSALLGALLEYYEAPGRFQLRLRQPAVLFSSIPEVLQLASRPGGGGSDVREAARFFIRAAMLFPGADHYAVFGLEGRSEPVQLKERYRLLMRLIHPDFAAGEWPPDAAIRVNRAYEVLSSAVLRRTYDEQLAAAKPPRGKPERRPAAPPARLAGPALRRFAMAAAGVAFVGGGILLLAPDSEPRRLVQRKTAPAPAPAPRIDAAPPAPMVLAASVPDEVVRPPLAVAAPHEEPPPAPEAVPSPPAQAPLPPSPAAARSQPPPQRLATLPRLVPAVPAEPVPIAIAPRVPETTTARAEPGPDGPQPAAWAVAAPSARVAASTPATRVEDAPRALDAPAAMAPALAEVQPLLARMLEALEGGRGDGLLALLEPSARALPAALAVSRHYEHVVGMARPVRVAHGEFRGEARGGVLQVTGLFRLHAGEPAIASPGQPFHIRADFATRGGKVHLTGLSSAAD